MHPIDKCQNNNKTKQTQPNHANLAWARRELAGVRLGDSRRDARLVSCLERMMDKPGENIPESMGGWAEAKAFYRLTGQPALTDRVILESHRDAVLGRAKNSGEDVFLSVQDTTTLNFSTHPKLGGQGPIGNSDKTTGLHLHNTLLIAAQSKKVLGLPDSKIYARESSGSEPRPAGERNRLPTGQKESYRWLESYRLSLRCAADLGPRARVVSVGDREADIYELLREASGHRSLGMGLLVRSRHNRALAAEDAEDVEERRLWQALSESRPLGKVVVEVPRSKGMRKRKAVLTARSITTKIRVPAHKKKYLSLSDDVGVTAVELVGEAPPGKTKPIRWRLLTTETVEGLDDVRRLAGWYCQRWQVEVMHRVLKTGCRVEKRQMRKMDRLKPVIALDLLVACYLMGMTSCARATPEAGAGEWLDPDDTGALAAYMEALGREVPQGSPGIGQAVEWSAALGGHLGRKNDDPPGEQTLWRGLRKLNSITEAWRLFNTP